MNLGPAGPGLQAENSGASCPEALASWAELPWGSRGGRARPRVSEQAWDLSATHSPVLSLEVGAWQTPALFAQRWVFGSIMTTMYPEI